MPGCARGSSATAACAAIMNQRQHFLGKQPFPWDSAGRIRERIMASEILGLAEIRTVADMTEAFRDEERCRRLLEAMVWPGGRICPGCGCRRSIALAGLELGRRARPGLYQCSDPANSP